MAVQFKKAVKYNSKGRIALAGPAGSGKSYTMMVALRAMVGPTGKIACVDTEHGSLSKYADLFEFDVIELDSFSPDNFMEALKAAEDNGYDAFGCDSLSHFWMGQDGALEWVDKAKKRSQSRDDMSGWKDYSPIERRLIDAMISSPCHIGVTMRTKTEYQEEEYTNARGEKKKKRIKIGLAPVQRQGLEYEFDLVGYMDDQNNLIVDKTRCPAYSQEVLARPDAKAFQAYVDWLAGVQREAPPAPPPVAPKREIPEELLAVFEGMAKNPKDRSHFNMALDSYRDRLDTAGGHAEGERLVAEFDAIPAKTAAMAKTLLMDLHDALISAESKIGATA